MWIKGVSIMKLNIQLTPEDYVKANLLNIRPRPVFKWVGYIFLTLMVVILGIAVFQAFAGNGDFFVPAVMLGCLAYLILFFRFRWPQRLKKIFRQQKVLHSPHSIELTDESVFIKGENGESRLTWDFFLKWKENDVLFTLYQSDVMLHIFPKGCFASPEEMAQFRELVVRKIGPARP